MGKEINNIPEKIHRKDLAELIGLTPRRVDQMAEDGVIPKSVDGMIDFKGAIQGLINRKKENNTPAAERLNLARAKREERKDRQEAGEDIPAPIVLKAWEEITATWKQRMLRVGNNVQSKIGLTEQQRAVVDDEVRGGLMELGKKLNYAAAAAELEGDEKGIEALK